jgi:hypothetical protein
MALSKFGQQIKNLIGQEVRLEQLKNGFLKITLEHLSDMNHYKITYVGEDKGEEIFRVERHEHLHSTPLSMVCTSREWCRVKAVSSVEEI